MGDFGAIKKQGMPSANIYLYTLQGTNISHLGKRKIIFKYALSGGYVNFLEGIYKNENEAKTKRTRSGVRATFGASKLIHVRKNNAFV